MVKVCINLQILGQTFNTFRLGLLPNIIYIMITAQVHIIFRIDMQIPVLCVIDTKQTWYVEHVVQCELLVTVLCCVYFMTVQCTSVQYQSATFLKLSNTKYFVIFWAIPHKTFTVTFDHHLQSLIDWVRPTSLWSAIRMFPWTFHLPVSYKNITSCKDCSQITVYQVQSLIHLQSV